MLRLPRALPAHVVSTFEHLTQQGQSPTHSLSIPRMTLRWAMHPTDPRIIPSPSPQSDAIPLDTYPQACFTTSYANADRNRDPQAPADRAEHLVRREN